MTDDAIEINQEWTKKANLQVRLLNGRELRVKEKGKRKTSKYTIDLLALEDLSKQKIVLGWKWFVAGIITILLMMVCLKYLPVLDESMLNMAAVIIAGLGVGAGCFFMAWKGTSRKQIFHSRNAGVPLVELVINNPSKKEFDGFINKVEKCIESSRQGIKISMKNQLTGEMKMLRRLNEEGVVSAAAYKTARAELLNQH